jgi:hypothetical protein
MDAGAAILLAASAVAFSTGVVHAADVAVRLLLLWSTLPRLAMERAVVLVLVLVHGR